MENKSTHLKVRSVLETEGAHKRILSFFGEDKEKVARFKSSLITISQNEDLAKCSAQSIIRSAFNLAETGLEINPILSQCYILRYKNDAEPIISYKGWQSLAERAGKRIKAFSVFNCDEFVMDLSDFDEKITFIPNFSERKESDDKWYQSNLKGVLVKIKDLKENYVKNLFISVSKIEKIKGKSPSAKSNYSPYNTWAEEMYLAKAIKYCLSRESLNFKDVGIAKAIKLENETEIKTQEKQAQETDALSELLDNADYKELEATEAKEPPLIIYE